MQKPDRLDRRIERAALRAFPALEEADLNGWLLRSANGHSRRTNSVQPIVHSGDVASDIATAEAWYNKRGTSCTFRMTPMSMPESLDGALEALGYLRQDPTSVQTLNLESGRYAVDDRIELAEHPTGVWFDAIMDSSRYMTGRRSTLEKTLQMIEPPAAFAVLRDGNEAIATGLAVADGDLVGLYSISTRPEVRRSGIGWMMSESLLAWGVDRGASIAYLQVMHINAAATELYRRMGFAPRYDYWYRCPVDRPPMNG